MAGESIQIPCPDGVALAATVHRPAAPARASLLVCSALGVPRRFYDAYASWLAGQGILVMTFDYRGTGDSPLTPTAARGTCLEDWGRLDMDAALGVLAQQGPGLPVFLVGHSCGGQLVGLAERSGQLAGAILVAATAPNWKRYPAPDRYQMWLVWHGLVPVLSFGRTHFPARRLGMSAIDVPAGVMAQWARWARSSDYLFSPEHGLDTARYASLDFPLLSLGFDDDSYASRAAIEALLRHYCAARVEHREIHVPSLGVGGLGHFGYFREKVRDSLWRDTIGWLDAVLGAQA